MPTTSPPIPKISSLLDDCPRSSPYQKLSDSKPVLSLPKPTLSPRTDKKPPLSPPPEVEDRKFDKDKSDRGSDPPSDPRAEPPAEPKSGAKAAENQRIEDDEDETKQETAVGKDSSVIDWATFDQILELDEEDSVEFSQGMVQEFYTQAETTFTEMDELFKKDQDLSALSEKGHFLKGSSAAIGLKEVHKSCQEIQDLGKLHDDTGVTISRAEALERLGKVLTRVRREYDEAKTCLDDYFRSKLEGLA